MDMKAFSMVFGLILASSPAFSSSESDIKQCESFIFFTDTSEVNVLSQVGSHLKPEFDRRMDEVFFKFLERKPFLNAAEKNLVEEDRTEILAYSQNKDIQKLSLSFQFTGDDLFPGIVRDQGKMIKAELYTNFFVTDSFAEVNYPVSFSDLFPDMLPSVEYALIGFDGQEDENGKILHCDCFWTPYQGHRSEKKINDHTLVNVKTTTRWMCR